jgi:diadenosine tetraphosphatase ApaH/serine/threonine PP2A family protein phosphatase
VKRAIVSDIHSNLEALNAVLADIASQGVTEILCLGDIVGYGPNPRECIDLVMKFARVVLGNHDKGAVLDPEGFSAGAERAIFWTRDQLEDHADDHEQNLRRWEFLLGLPSNHRENDFLFVHGSPRSPLNEYVFPEDVHNPRKLEKLFGLIDRYCFQGHTHVPGVFTESGGFHTPDQLGQEYELERGKSMINVGSVGQPRDGDPRSCYVLVDEQGVRFRRVEYAFRETARKIYDTPELDNFLGDRLFEGR